MFEDFSYSLRRVILRSSSSTGLMTTISLGGGQSHRERGRVGEGFRGPHMVRLISAMRSTAKAHAPTRQTVNVTKRRRCAGPSKGASARALSTASTATQASITTTKATERKPPLVMRSTIPERRGPPLGPGCLWAERGEDSSCEVRLNGVLRSSAHERRLYLLKTLIQLKRISNAVDLKRIIKAP